MSLLILSASDSRRVVDTFEPAELELCMARVFQLYSKSKLQTTPPSDVTEPSIDMPHRSKITSTQYTTLFMPALINMEQENQRGGREISAETAIKIVSIPKISHGLPATTVLLDSTTGAARAIVNARMLTAVRNAAGSLVSTALYGPTSPRRLVVFGTGLQIQLHVNFFLRRFPSIETCTIICRSINERAKTVRAELEAKFLHVSVRQHGFEFSAADQAPDPLVEAAVQNADIIICATPSTRPLFPSRWVRTGTHIILIGSYTPSMREVDVDLIRRAIPRDRRPSSAPNEPESHLIVDSVDACLKEAGELLDAGVESSQMTELGSVIGDSLLRDVATWSESISGRRLLGFPAGPSETTRVDFDGPVTIFKSVGLGVQDVAIASAVVQRATELGVGTVIPEYDC